MNFHYALAFCNPQYCADQGKPLTWHVHQAYETREELDAALQRFRSLPGLKLRTYRMSEDSALMHERMEEAA